MTDDKEVKTKGPEAHKNKHPDMQLTEVVRFLESKTGDASCPFCGTGKWNVEYVRLSNEPDRIFGAYAIPAGMPFEFGQPNDTKSVRTLPASGGRSILLVICENCGFMRPHDYKTIWDWVQTECRGMGGVPSEAPND